MVLVGVQIGLVLKDETAMGVATFIESVICPSVVVRPEVALTVTPDMVEVALAVDMVEVALAVDMVEVAFTVTADVVEVAFTVTVALTVDMVEALTVTADIMVEVEVTGNVVANLVISAMMGSLTGGGALPISNSNTYIQQQNAVTPATNVQPYCRSCTIIHLYTMWLKMN